MRVKVQDRDRSKTIAYKYLAGIGFWRSAFENRVAKLYQILFAKQVMGHY
jgi:hypothetical protein